MGEIIHKNNNVKELVPDPNNNDDVRLLSRLMILPNENKCMYSHGVKSIYKSTNLFEPVTNAICKQTGKKEEIQITTTQ